MKMKRRSLGLLAGASVAALKFAPANAQTAADPNLLKTTLTPFGSERAGNADGSIPAWTGGYTTLPDGWQSGQAMPDFFADEQPVVVIDASNMAQHADKIPEGIQALMTKYGFSIKVYPTHRPQAMPPVTYDNTAKNLATARFIDPNNPQNGFTGAFGGIPFPIPDTANPLNAGVQIIYNHLNHWQGYAYTAEIFDIVVENGAPEISTVAVQWLDFPYYHRPDIRDVQWRQYEKIIGPPVLVGEETLFHYYNNNSPEEAWELLNGQGRVRRAPELSYDTPNSFADDVFNYDEDFGFQGAPDEYNWKYIGKQEMYIPYNNNGLILLPWQQAVKGKFLDPDYVRWELHRVWVVEATVRPGRRNVLARRRYYVDEDTWTIGETDAWDANGNLFHVQYLPNLLRPDMPGTFMSNAVIYNLQTGLYGMSASLWNQRAHPTLQFLPSLPDSQFDPQNMAASAQY